MPAVGAPMVKKLTAWGEWRTIRQDSRLRSFVAAANGLHSEARRRRRRHEELPLFRLGWKSRSVCC
jgi:hypothetical protein